MTFPIYFTFYDVILQAFVWEMRKGPSPQLFHEQGRNTGAESHNGKY